MEYILIFLVGVIGTSIGTLAGGGGFITLPMLLLLGTPIHSAIGVNKVSNTISSFSSFFYLFRNKKIKLKESLWIIPVSLAGGISGSFIASMLDSDYMYIIAIVLLIASFILSMIRKDSFSGEPRPIPKILSMLGIYAIGIYNGLFGPGQATLMMYFFGFLKVSYIKTIGFVRLASFSSSFGAAVIYILNGHVIWLTALCLILGSVTGAQIGVRIAEKLQPKFVKILLQVVTIALIVQIIVQQFSS